MPADYQPLLRAVYYCPSCGFGGLSGPAYENLGPPPWSSHGAPPYADRYGFPSYEVCSCCGFEFGFDDDPGAGSKSSSFEEYRAECIASGASWFLLTAKPVDWDLQMQLRAIGAADPTLNR